MLSAAATDDRLNRITKRIVFMASLHFHCSYYITSNIYWECCKPAFGQAALNQRRVNNGTILYLWCKKEEEGER
jgi:hypothetical protein